MKAPGLALCVWYKIFNIIRNVKTSVVNNGLMALTKKYADDQQGKFEEFDCCDRPSNLAQIE